MAHCPSITDIEISPCMVLHSCSTVCVGLYDGDCMVGTVWWGLYGEDCMVGTVWWGLYGVRLYAGNCMVGTVWWGLYSKLILLRDSGMIRLSEPPVPCQVLPMECPSVMNSDKLLKMCHDIPNFPQFPTLQK